MLMGSRVRKGALIAHVACSLGWFGAVAAYLAMAIAGRTNQDAQLVRGAYRTMELIGWYVIVPLALAALATGLIQALGTRWGLVGHYWIVVKLLLVLVSLPILLVHMQQTSHLSALAGDPTSMMLLSTDLVGARNELVERPIEALLVLLAAATLAVYKPWGIIRYRRRNQNTQDSGRTR